MEGLQRYSITTRIKTEKGYSVVQYYQGLQSHSITTRIKTDVKVVYHIVFPGCRAIPLQQGLRRDVPNRSHSNLVTLQSHSITTRIKTVLTQGAVMIVRLLQSHSITTRIKTQAQSNTHTTELWLQSHSITTRIKTCCANTLVLCLPQLRELIH